MKNHLVVVVVVAVTDIAAAAVAGIAVAGIAVVGTVVVAVVADIAVDRIYPHLNPWTHHMTNRTLFRQALGFHN